MFKFLRRYNKWILAVGGVLLMITFLIPQAIDSLSRSAAERRATFARVGNNEAVPMAEWVRAQNEVQLLDKIEQFGMSIRGLGKIREPAHWFLLVREAQQAGLVSIATLDDQSLNVLMSISGQRDPGFIRQAIGRMNGVNILTSQFANSATYSDLRMRTFAERIFHMVSAELVTIKADEAKAPTEPTEEELRAQFEKHADTLKVEGASDFGYKFPNRAKMEWITINADAVRTLVKSSREFDRVAQRLHWRKYAPKSGETPDTATPNPRSFPPVNDSGEIPQSVSDDLLNELARNKMDEIVKFATGQVQLNRRGFAEKDGFVELPADWDSRKINLQQLAADIQKQFGLELPAYEAIGDRWLDSADLAKLPGIGTSHTEKFGQSKSLVELFNALKEFGGTGAVPMQENLVGPPMTGGEDTYLFRITDTDAMRKPASLDEVREQVTGDLRRMAHYKALEAEASAIEQAARTSGLLSVASDHDISVQRSTNVSLVNHQMALLYARNGMAPEVSPYALPLIGPDRKTTEAILDRARALPLDEPLTALPVDQRVFVLTVPDKLALLIVRLEEQNPLTKESYTDLVQAGAVQSLMASEEQRLARGGDEKAAENAADRAKNDLLAKVFSLEALSKRHNFVADIEKATNEETKSASAAAPGT